MSEVSDQTRSRHVASHYLSETLGLGIGATRAEELWETEPIFDTPVSILKNRAEKPFETLASVGLSGQDPFHDWDKYLPQDTEPVNTDPLSPIGGDPRQQNRINSGGRLFPDPRDKAQGRAIDNIYQEFLRQRHSS